MISHKLLGIKRQRTNINCQNLHLMLLTNSSEITGLQFDAPNTPCRLHKTHQWLSNTNSRKTKSNTTGVTCGAGSSFPDIIPGF